MADKTFPKSGLPIRRTVELLPVVFQTDTNDKFLSGVLDPLVQPGVLDKVVGYIGRRHGKTYNGSEIYVDTDNTLRSRYQLEPGVVYKNNDTVENFYDYLDFKNQLAFFGNTDERDDKITSQSHYAWNPPVDWDKFVNYREYYWQPSGPPTTVVYGQTANVISTYKVVLGTTGNSFVFTPDAYTNNPTITLYRGQTYKFKVNAPGEGFSIRTNYDTGSLIFKPFYGYSAGDLAVYDNKLWRAKQNINPGDGSSITIDSLDWEYLEPASAGDALEYNKGITNNGTENGTVTFVVPYDAPSNLFYQGLITPDAFGRFLIADIEENTYINVDNEIVGKSTYTSSNSVEFSNGMIVEFLGNVNPSKYASGSWLIEGVGEAITLVDFNSLIVPVLTTDVPEVLFDNNGFDTQPFDDATAYPTYKDYITIARNSVDSNPWSRYNRWFHRSVLEKAYSSRGQDFTATETARAKRPIIEFRANLQLFNHGSVAKQTVDYIDDYTTDIFSIIEGSTGYNVDGEFLFEGARVLFVADTDTLSNNKIYEVSFIIHNGKKQIHLKESIDTVSLIGQGVLVRRGSANSGKMVHFDGTQWISSQEKTSVNQAPMFDAFDANNVSFSNGDSYPTSTFTGTPLFNYKVGNGRVDTELGFPLSYLNINNVGDIQFDWKWDNESFAYTVNREPKSKKLSTGFYKFNVFNTYENGWIDSGTEYQQPIFDSQIVVDATSELTFNTIAWDETTSVPNINVYLNGILYTGTWTRDLGTFTFSTTLAAKDVVSLKIISDVGPDQGYYEIPSGLERNPLNDELTSFTLGQAIDHVSSALEFDSNISGPIPGNSNLRDIANYQKYARRFLKHAGLVPVVMMALCDKTHNIVKSIQYAKKSYTDFKNNFLARAIEIEYNSNTVDFVDDIINSLTKTKDSTSPFADSGMIGSGAYTSINYTVDDAGIKVFALSAKFDLITLNRTAVYVYLNGTQLLNTRDYTFNSTFGFIQLLVDLSRNDIVEIREYSSTAVNHIPPTPTVMGLYKKFTPMIFIDDTYADPREVLQGHDGSITATYGDFRDSLLLELEYRIYNNIRIQYNEKIFDVDSMVAGYNGVGLYKKSQLDTIVSQEFLKWIQNTNISYTINSYFDSQNSFTYTYSKMSDPTKTQSLPGYWRGVYQYFYDTDRPHRCPWEMLGFSEEPTWWQTVYGSAPYTSGNLILWEDLANGFIRQGSRAGRYDRYKRPTLLRHIPVNGDGQLLSPLDSGLAQDFSLINNTGSFVLGDIGPAEYAWRASSEWPFAVALAMCLMKPFEFIADSFDRSKIVLNNLGQSVHKDTLTFSVLSDITNNAVTDLSSGLVKYLISYTASRGLNPQTLWDKIGNLDVALSHRMSGFVDQTQQKFLLDSKNPSATSSNVYIPNENYDIIFNISAPIASVAYSGIILEKTEGGWVITGYDDIQPYFNYHLAMPNQRDPVITVGGLSETFLDWITDKSYTNGTIIRYQNNFYRALKTHDSGGSFDANSWQKLGSLPKRGAVEALRRRNFNTLAVRRLSYGTKFTSIQQVVDFLLGYESYLKSIGFSFNNYDSENKVSQDWLSSAKEFMFWTKHNWEIGSLISISPGAENIDITIPVGVADNILDGFYDYQLLKGDGKPLNPKNVNVKRSFQNITVQPVNTTDGIFYLKLYYVLKEHVAIFDDRTVFNDIIYDKTTGYRQGRIKVQGFRTTDWDGDYTSPGFMFDNVNITSWLPWTDYNLGDIVSYRSYNWTSLVNQLGTETFNATYWTKLDSTPVKQLIPNFDYRINSFADYFEVSSEGLDLAQRDLARHTIGYQQRNYLQNLSDDSVTQFQLYQGFIREKGTSNAITKIFGKLSRSGSDSIELNEEWAFLSGQMGGVDQITEIEVELDKNKFNLNPQLFLIEEFDNHEDSGNTYHITSEKFTIAPIPFSVDINPTSVEVDPTSTAGYVSLSQYEHTIATIEDIITLDITTVYENDHIWITFYKDSWTVFRANEDAILGVQSVLRYDDTTVSLTLNRPHSLVVDQYVGFRDILNLTGFYKIIEITNNTISVEVVADVADPELDLSSTVRITILEESRFNNYQSIDDSNAALLDDKSRLFIDNNGDALWEVVEKNKLYSPKSLTDYGTTTPVNAGKKVIYDNINKQIISSIPGSGLVMVYVEDDNNLKLKQIISPPTGFYEIALGSFGNKLAKSADGRYLVVGSPEASGVRTNYRGEWATDVAYFQDDIVLYGARLWKAINANTVIGDGSSTLAVNTDDWALTSLIPVTTSTISDQGFYNQGMVSVYEFNSGRYTHVQSFSSPRPADNEQFGSEVAISYDGTNYCLAVSAVGSYNDTGRVYLFDFNGTTVSNLENAAYRGIYDPLEIYYAGDIVWQASQDPIAEGVKGNLWQAQEGQAGDGSTLEINSQNWLKVSDISTHSSLPTSISVENDGSTLEFAYTGLLSTTQMAELVKPGDNYGFSLVMTSDASILVVGAPNADGQFFANYRGLWRADVEYVEGEVVRYSDPSTSDPHQYYKLGDVYIGADSTYRSYNEEPAGSENWQVVGDSTTQSSGKVFVYKRTTFGSYELTQMINAASISSFTDIDSGLVISTGDQFGFSMDMDLTGTVLVVSSPKADINFQDQGSVYVLGLDVASTEYRVKQKLDSFEIYPNEYFGYGVSVSPDGAKVVVGAKNTYNKTPTYFDMLSDTTFDFGRTSFFAEQGFTGGVYVFDKKGERFLLTEKLQDTLSANESFGFSVDCVGSKIVVGSPYYRPPVLHVSGLISFEGPYVGKVRMFSKNESADSWTVLTQQQPVVDLRKIRSIELYDNVLNEKIQDIDYVDPAKGKIINLAERELAFKTPYDPAVYTIGTDAVVVDPTINWLDRNVGKLWWNVGNAKWIYAEQSDTAYRTGNWNQLAEGGSIDVYEWVGTPLLPSEWSAVADTNEGLALGISGQPLYPNDDVFSVRSTFNALTGAISETTYYFWVRSKSTTPTNRNDRTMSASAVATMILNPNSTGLAFIALVDSDKFYTYNFESVMLSDTALLNFKYNNSLERLNPVHREYQLLTEDVADSLPSKKLENKWIDSLVGTDLTGNRVPDTKLPAKQKYGISFRPRQGMFINRPEALKIAVTRINTTLLEQPFATLIDFNNLNSKEIAPAQVLNLYDVAVDTEIDLQNVGTIRTKRAVLSANIVDGELDTIDIIDPGFGYKPKELFDQETPGVYVGPPITIVGDGINATAACHIDGQGRIITVVVTNRGKKYSTLTANVRYFSVLVNSDSTINNFWSIYSWDDSRKVFFRSQSQAYDTTKYWSYQDWWATGYGIKTRITKELLSIFDEERSIILVGDLIQIKEYGAGGWAVFEKTSDTGSTFLDRFLLVGRQNGTIQISAATYDTTVYGIGFDNTQSFDTTEYDIGNSIELRNILKAVKEDIFKGDYSVEWNKLFFASMRHVLSEQSYVDWMFKTSFLNATHNVGAFEQRINYKNDNLQSYQEFINEVKPYRTTVREYVSRYDNIETANSAIADFDLPPTYSVVDGVVLPITANRNELTNYPWKWWADNNGYEIVDIQVSNAGAGYTLVPKVLIEGNGTGATAQAYISNGTVSGITITNPGSGYTRAPTVLLVGSAGAITATAIAIIGNTKVRTFDMSIKFDRVAKDGDYAAYVQEQTFIATGDTSVFNLNYAPTRNKNDITIYKNNQLVLNSDYTLSLYYSNTDSYSLLRGRIRFNTSPAVNDVIVVSYEKNVELFNAVNRIDKFYAPISGMIGKELNQLMTGIDFGGVQIQGTTFDVTGGWDALPWFTDNWDSVEASSDYYVVCDGSTGTITLPYVPTEGQEINIYIKRSGSIATTRIDDPYYIQTQPAVEGQPADPEYNNGAIIDVVGNGSDFFKREVTTNGVRIMGAGAVGGQAAVPDAWLEKVARMFELFTDPTGAGINQAIQRQFIKDLSGDAGDSYHAGFPTLQRVARGAGSDYTPNFLTDEGIESWNLSPLFDTHVANDMVWYLNSTGDGYGIGEIDAQEVIEHVFHTLHMHGLPAFDLKMYPEFSADWQSGDLFAAIEEAYDAGVFDPSGYVDATWKTDPELFPVIAKEYLYLLNFSMFEYTGLWDGDSLAPEWSDSMRTQSGILANNPLGYALFNTYIAPVISKPSLATINSIFGDGNTPAQDNPALAGVSGYVVDLLVGGSPAVDDNSSLITNPNAEMPTFVGDGLNATIDIGSFIGTIDGDTLIFRPIESDGAVTITDDNLLDTAISGGSLSAISNAYVTATGTLAEEIAILGGKFIDPDQVPAPEENIPGQVLDSVSIKVYNNTPSGSAALQSKISEGDGTTTEYTIGQAVIESNAVFVYIDKIKQDLSVNYTLDLENYNVEFTTAPSVGTIVEILSLGIGGLKILDYQQFVADGATNLFLTNANYDYTSSIFVTVNGEYVDTGFRNSTDVVDAIGRTLVEFGFYPNNGDIIKIVCLEASSDVDSSGISIVKVNTQTVYFEGSTRSFDLDSFVDLSRGSAANSMIVEVNGLVLKGADTTYAVYNGTTNAFTLGTDPFEPGGSILPSNINVFVNNELKAFITDYTFEGPTKVLTLSNLTIGDIVKIENDLRAEYSIVGNNIVIAGDVNISSVDETDNVRIDVTWFSEYPSMDIISDEKAGGKVQYQLARTPISPSYVWVYKNGVRLTQEQDYYLSLPRGVVYLNVDSTVDDNIRTISFATEIYRLPSAYEISKDMLNIYHFKRFAKGEVKLANALNYYDTTITVDDSSTLADPIPSRNVPGAIHIDNERIEYMQKTGNVLSQLRRGTQGTPIKEAYASGSAVVDVGYQETIPYNETQDRFDFYSDGSTLIIGPLSFAPSKGSRSSTWYRDTIPSTYGPCDELEIFAAGRRLKKDPQSIWVENNGAYSPDADTQVEAEFSVDGSAAYIRLTNILPAGTRITLIRRQGKTWYDRGETTASNGVTLLENGSPIAKFIAQKSTSIPE